MCYKLIFCCLCHSWSLDDKILWNIHPQPLFLLNSMLCIGIVWNWVEGNVLVFFFYSFPRETIGSFPIRYFICLFWVHQAAVFPFNLISSNLTLFESQISLYSNILSTFSQHSKNSSPFMLPLKFGISVWDGLVMSIISQQRRASEKSFYASWWLA